MDLLGYTEEELLPKSKQITSDQDELSNLENATDNDDYDDEYDDQSIDEMDSEGEAEDDSDSLEDLNTDEDSDSSDRSENTNLTSKTNKQDDNVCIAHNYLLLIRCLPSYSTTVLFSYALKLL